MKMQNFNPKVFTLCLIPFIIFYIIRGNYWLDRIDENEPNRKVWIFVVGFMEGLFETVGLDRVSFLTYQSVLLPINSRF